MQPRKNEPGKPYTGYEGVAPRIRRFVRGVADLACRPLNTLRLLALGPLEGSFSLEFALHGAQVLAMEGREANLEKVLFARDVFGLKNLELVRDDIRNLRREKHGVFDVVICSGVLYHLDAPSQVPFLRAGGSCAKMLCKALTPPRPNGHESCNELGQPDKVSPFRGPSQQWSGRRTGVKSSPRAWVSVARPGSEGCHAGWHWLSGVGAGTHVTDSLCARLCPPVRRPRADLK